MSKSELAQELEATNIKLSSVYVGESATDGWRHDLWIVTIERDGKTFTTSYRTGLGHRKAPSYDKNRPRPVKPELADVVHCLLLDAQSGQMSFDEFCGEFGYDSYSRKALATWEACVNTAGPLRRVLGVDFGTLSGLEH